MAVVSVSGARFVGRVGALAVALGIGAAVVSMPVAAADSRDSGGGSDSPSSEGPSSSAGSSSAGSSSAVRESGRRGGRAAAQTKDETASQAEPEAVVEPELVEPVADELIVPIAEPEPEPELPSPAVVAEVPDRSESEAGPAYRGSPGLVAGMVNESAHSPARHSRPRRPQPSAPDPLTKFVGSGPVSSGEDLRSPAPAATGLPSLQAESFQERVPQDPAAAIGTPPETPVALTYPAPAVATAAADPGCALCGAAQGQSLGQTITTVINRSFNSAFTLLFNGGPLADLFTGALVLVRRSLFFIPEGVTAKQTTTGLDVTVNTGSVAYLRQDGAGVQVSGDPGFWGAKTYTGNPGLAISVTSGGNAGGAGVVLTDGSISADLATIQIDAIRFLAGSSFTGKVTATAAGPITLRDGVRGLQGVTLNAPVVLANDVEVDAGSHDVMFGGTVDAAKAGKQSLSVTALGTTTFAGAVGGSAALRSLLTQGIAPVAITQSEDTRTIPLHFLPWAEKPKTGANEVKYGIDVALGDNPSQVYEFDTGGNGFFAGYNTPFWQNVPVTSDPVSILFTSGNQFDGVVATPTVTIGRGDQTVTTAQPIAVGAILSGSSPKTGAFDFTDPLAPPIEGSFFGDFGASLAVLPVSGTSYVLANPLLQLPGKLSNGYLVQLGPIGVTPQVTVGLTDDLRAQFPYAVPIAPAQGGGTYPVSGWPQLNIFGITPLYFADGPDGRIQIKDDTCTTDCTLPTIVDSGAPSMSIRLGTQKGPYQVDPGRQLQPGVTFIAEFPTAEGKQPLTWSFVAGNNGSVDLANYANSSAAFSGDNLNTGLNLYNFYDVIFDVQEQVLRLRPTGGQATVIANSVTTTGTQTYRQNAELSGNYVTGGAAFAVAGVTTLESDTTVDAGAGDVTFSGTVDGGYSLTVKSSGATTFARQVGSQQILDSLTTDAGGSTSTFQVKTTNTQNYGDDITLHGQYLTKQGSFLVSGDATLAAGVSVQAGDVNTQNPSQAGGITFSGKVDAEPGRGYPLSLVSASGKVVLASDVGSTNPLGGLTVESSAPAGINPEFVASRRIAMDGSLGFADDDGLVIGQGITAKLAAGGLITNFAGDGIRVLSSAGSLISNFAVSGSGTANIAVDGAANVAVTKNALSGGAGDGLQLKNAQAVTVTDNSIRGSAGNGVYSKGSTTIVMMSNTISGNGIHGVSIDTASTGNAILANSIFSNSGLGISLNKGAGNGGQEAPRDVQVAPTGLPVIIISGKLNTKGYTGAYTMQAFYTPGTDAALAEGQQFLGQQDVSVAGEDFSFNVPFDGAQSAGFITVTATPTGGAPNTSEFSNAAAI